MHIYFSAIGGAGISSLALIAHQAGFEVSGSDKRNSKTIEYLKKHGIDDIYIGQSEAQIASVHQSSPIDWLVYSSAVILENPDSEELEFCKQHGIKSSKRDEFLNFLLTQKNQKLIAVAGTHGKSTTTAMIIWLFKQLGVSVSYALPAKISFGENGYYDPQSEYFIYEADEFDKNFLSFKPYFSVISGVSWDHHEIFTTRDQYKQAFNQFLDQSEVAALLASDAEYLGLQESHKIKIINQDNIDQIKLFGLYNRQDALLAIEAVKQTTNRGFQDLIAMINQFPGLERRMEQIIPNLYSDYAHTPEKIRAAMSVASEMAKTKNQLVYVIYEPLTNRRQHYIKDQYSDCFNGAKHIYWLPSYLAREDPKLPIIEPEDLIARLPNPNIASAAKMDQSLIEIINDHLSRGEMVIALNGGGGEGLDEWLRANFNN
ncbi:MAG TPA: Mur ligase domain-containing protein [Candidatus Dormibacteraeota bacterium]|nr:Mur ligase domain-containing protein [Candidatus Dormibacteraeota bacterium]